MVKSSGAQRPPPRACRSPQDDGGARWAQSELTEIGALVEHGAHTAAWAEPRPGANVARAAAFMLFAQIEPGHACPISMTHAVVPSLQVQPGRGHEYGTLASGARLAEIVQRRSARGGRPASLPIDPRRSLLIPPGVL